uniref:Uncharacterized protein n=1 Tax=Rhodopseudomonas palustris (strain BisA53) TaxID=316055 RepID=Q07IR5_RHOP5
MRARQFSSPAAGFRRYDSGPRAAHGMVHVAGLAHQGDGISEQRLFAVNAAATERLMQAPARAGTSRVVHVFTVSEMVSIFGWAATGGQRGGSGANHPRAPLNARPALSNLPDADTKPAQPRPLYPGPSQKPECSPTISPANA